MFTPFTRNNTSLKENIILRTNKREKVVSVNYPISVSLLYKNNRIEYILFLHNQRNMFENIKDRITIIYS